MTKDRKKMQEITVGCLFLFGKKIFKGNRKKINRKLGRKWGLRVRKGKTEE